ncbi:gliding motility-associated C-terminal domain-containing protein [Flavobacterium sp. XGLA_31]|uniref:T9SS type B sorting domain-containing protein n=1 Tax=Flavobacterium sp. XGLA_31 TaxID=3447666 RepID=UPI003F40159B
MKLKRYLLVFITVLSCFFSAYGQDVNLFQQFNGRYDFTFIGNTMNSAENNSIFAYVTGTSSTATLNMNPTDEIEKAYLYWAGSGDGDFEVTLNAETITPDRTFSLLKTFNGVDFTYFSAFKDITNQVLATGNGDYTLSDLDISAFEELHLQRRTNFAGWAIVIVYKNPSLPLNQINVYDGLQGVPDDLVINLNSLNVLDNNNSKIGFLAWEGDALLATEHFQFNNNVLSNALNPTNNVFNGTNSVTGSNTLYNMDLDIYDIQNYIQVGDATAQIKLSSTQDFIMINTVVTKLNNQLPDATVTIDSVDKVCDSNTIDVHYTVGNFNCTNSLPAQTPIAIYVNGQWLQTTYTATVIPVDGSLSSQITLHLPEGTPTDFEIQFVVDDTGNGTGIVNELNENNNGYSITESLWHSPGFAALDPLISCNEGFTKGTFDFAAYEDAVKLNPDDVVHFYESAEDAIHEVSPILNLSNYQATTTPKEIFVRIDNAHCYSLTSFELKTRNCPPIVYNYISANNDGKNDEFYIGGLKNIFLDYRIEIYNRWGRLIWTGDPNSGNWNGYVRDGFELKKSTDGTFYYLLFLNDPDYPNPLNGFIYIVH